MLLHHLKLALRQIRRNPGYSIAVILTLALAIGVNTAVFTMLDGFLLRRLPYPQLNRLAVLMHHLEFKKPHGKNLILENDDAADSLTWQALKERVPDVSTAVAGEEFGSTEGVDLDTGAGPSAVARYVRAAHVSAHYFQVLGIKPMLGRGFTQEEDSPGAGKFAVISYTLWSSFFHKSDHLLGHAIRLKGAAYTVVGIMPPHVVMPHSADVWIPLMPSDPHGMCAGDNCLILMRLKPGANWRQVRAELAHMPPPRNVNTATQKAMYYAEPIQKYKSNYMGSRVKLLMLAVSFILLIACANLAGLSLVRIARKTPEIATRIALGASLWAILAQQWAESLILSALGAGVGLGIAFELLTLLTGMLPSYMIPPGGFHLDAHVLLFSAAVTVLTSIIFGALPALHARKIQLQKSLATGNRTLAGGTSRLRQFLIGGQLALTVVLLAGAGLLVRTVIYLETLPPGFNPNHVLTATLSLDNAHYQQAPEFHTLLNKGVAALKQIPGVQNAAMGLSVPYQRGLNDGITIIDGKRAGFRWGSSLAWVTPGYFATLQMPILSGRALNSGDTTHAEPVAVVNTDFAREFYRTLDPVGLHFKVESKTYTIVGVVPNVVKRPGMIANAPLSTEPVFYIPAAQADQRLVNLANKWFQPSWIIRYQGGPAAMEHEVQAALRNVAPDLPVAGFRSMKQVEQAQIQGQNIEVLLVGVLAMLALLLSVIGIYALVSNLVVQRTHEIGIRVALGSPWERVIVAVGMPGMTAALGGVCAGLVASIFALRVLKSAIYGIHDLDPVTLTVVPLLLIALAAAASIVPSLRVTRIDPAQTLREG